MSFVKLLPKDESRLVLLLDILSYGVQLNVTRSLINCTNFTIAVKLFDWVIFGEAYSSHPFDTFRSSQSRHFWKPNKNKSIKNLRIRERKL